MNYILLTLLLLSPALDTQAQASGKPATPDSLPALKQLKEVMVRANKPLLQQQAYGTVVNVQSSVLTKGSSVLEVLERSPGVNIDRRTNGIALNGKSGVMVMLNGKLLRMSADQLMIYLQGMTAADVEKIELLNTPPAKYDAAGNAGMINIVIRKNRNQGNFSLTGGYGYGEKAAASLNFGRTLRNTALYGSYSFSHDKSYYDWFARATDDMKLLGGPSSSDFLSVTKPVGNSHNIILGADVNLTPRTIIGGNINGNISRVTDHTVNHGEYLVNKTTAYNMDADIRVNNNWDNLGASVYAERKMREGEQLNIDLDYLYYKNNRPSAGISAFVDSAGHTPGTNDTLFAPVQRTFSVSSMQIGVLKMDYSRQLSPKIKIETGVKGTYTKNNSNSRIESFLDDAWVSSTAAINNIIMKEAIGAAYGSLEAQLHPALRLVAGLRYEYVQTQMDDPENKQQITKRTSGKFFPGIFLTWKKKEAEWQLSYTKRISRPAYNDLASFVIYSGPTSVETGNPMLKPTITNNLKLGYNYNGYSFSLLYSRDDAPIARYQLTPNPAGEVIWVSPQNLLFQDNVSFQALLPWKVNDWWNMNFGFTGGWRQFKLDYTATPVQKQYFGFNTNFSTAFTLPARFYLEISGWYNSASYDGSKKVDPFGALNAGLKKELNKNGGSLQLTVTDILRTVHISSYFGTLAEEAFNLKSKVTFQPESGKMQIIKLTWAKTFGNQLQRKQRSGAAEESNRVRK
ncbi:TonB-dependent receptor [Chitinophaga sp. RCC_12]|uniref:TonB-dependent receptor domain-containing protein n=1 Tax=Chitinophaga sp. RCC_12 TaxID=3239226 RepID=UPI0035241890